MMFNLLGMPFIVMAASIGQNYAPAKVGEMTYYDPATGNQVACGGYYGPNDRIAALGAGSFDGRSVCGKTASITYNGKTVTATITDRCEACKDGDIDVTPTVFQELAPISAGRVPGVSWALV